MVGCGLPGGWTVIELFDPGPNPTGGHFSFGYRVRRDDGAEAFLKALDYSAALRAPNTAQVLQAMTTAYVFEVDLLRLTHARGCDRIVRALGDGEIDVDGPSGPEKVSYLIFELADGDVRKAMDTLDRIDAAWKLRSLHHVATGIRQLHDQGIAHQDLKPSNVLVFQRSSSKVGDLGRAAQRGASSPFDDLNVAGDFTYAPFELLYSEVAADWGRRRQACDLYLLGSLGVFMFSGAGVTALVTAELADEHKPRVWGDSYAAVLPFVRDAYNRVMEQFENSLELDETIKPELLTRIRDLCDPDPALRGHPVTRSRHGNPYALERHVAAFNLLARRAEIAAFSSRAA
jgi:serine/threonine protein kinase